MSSVKARVALGVKWLDRNRPGWEREVVVKRLDMSEGCACILGQVFAKEVDPRTADGFDYVMDHLIPRRSEPETWSTRHGFDYQEGRAFGDDYAALKDEWTRVIKDRRSESGGRGLDISLSHEGS